MCVEYSHESWGAAGHRGASAATTVRSSSARRWPSGCRNRERSRFPWRPGARGRTATSSRFTVASETSFWSGRSSSLPPMQRRKEGGLDANTTRCDRTVPSSTRPLANSARNATVGCTASRPRIKSTLQISKERYSHFGWTKKRGADHTASIEEQLTEPQHAIETPKSRAAKKAEDQRVLQEILSECRTREEQLSGGRNAPAS